MTAERKPRIRSLKKTEDNHIGKEDASKKDMSVRKSDSQIIRKQLYVLVSFFLIALFAFLGWRWGEDSGWGDPNRAVKLKMEKANQAFVNRNMDEAIEYYQAVVDKYPDHPVYVQALTQLATAFEESGDLQTASQTYENLLGELKDRDDKKDLKAFTLLQVAKIEIKKMNYEQALKVFSGIREQYPKTDWSGEALSGMGEVHQKQADYLKAIESYQAVIKELPGGFLAAEAQAAIGECYESMGETKKAIAAYQVVLDEYPSAVWDQAKQRIEILESQIAVGKTH